jgi:tripartite-type tricarboxylate transporter receptor subunit TctC
MKPFTSFSVATAAAAALTLGVFATPASAFDYSGKRVEMIIPYGTGGGSDVWARFFAPRLTAALPGNPTIVVRNIPGGGSITGTNQFAERAKPDGLTVLGTSGSTQFPYLLGDPRVRYDYRDWVPILVSPVGGVVFARPELGATSAADIKNIRGKRLVVGSQGATALDLLMALSFDILGFDLQIVYGMKGRGPARLAFERGESTLDWQTTPAYFRSVQPLVEAGNAVPLFSYGSIDDNGNLIRDANFPSLPHLGEVYRMTHGKDPRGPAWNAWMAFFAAGFAAQKIIVLHKDTPQEIINVWHAAVKQVVSAPDFNDAAEKALGDARQGIGPQAATLYKLATEIDSESRNWVRNWLTQKHNVKF